MIKIVDGIPYPGSIMVLYPHTSVACALVVQWANIKKWVKS